MMASTYAIAVRDDPHMKGDYNQSRPRGHSRTVRDDPHMKGDYNVGGEKSYRPHVRDDPHMKETYTLRCFATLSMTVGGSV